MLKNVLKLLRIDNNSPFLQDYNNVDGLKFDILLSKTLKLMYAIPAVIIKSIFKMYILKCKK